MCNHLFFYCLEDIQTKEGRLLRLDVHQWVSHLSWHQKPPEGVLSLGPSSEVLTRKVWGWAQGSAFLTNSYLMLMLLIQGSYFENPCSVKMQMH